MPSIQQFPLNIVIVGAGIAGLSAAIACRRAGHIVQIYERSALNNELGAAINVCPNASRGLLAWGLDPVKAKFVTCKKSYRAKADTLKVFHQSDEGYITEKYGSPWYLAHRVDLHDELKRLAVQNEGVGRPAIISLRSDIVGYNVEAGSVTFADGSEVTGDLVIAADGVHSEAVEAISGAPNPALPTRGYNIAYRFLISTKEIAADPETVHFIENDDGTMKIFVGDEKRLVWYPCWNNEGHNFVGIFHNDEVIGREDWHTSVDKTDVLNRYAGFHPSLLAVIAKAKDTKQWPLLFRAPIPTWHKGKVLLIGDAAHPMLPHQGQGGAQAIEDTIALGIVLTNCTPEDLPSRLQVFEDIRRVRASVMQIFSNAGQDEAEKIHAEAAKFIPAETVPKTPEEFFSFNFGYDIVRDSKQQMEKLDPSWELPLNFFDKEPGPGTYP